MEGVAMSTSNIPPSSSPIKLHIPKDVLIHQCIEHHRADDLNDLEAEFTQSLNEWNKEFMMIKYLQGEYKQKYDHKIKEVKVLRRSYKSIAFKTIIQNHVQEAYDHIYDCIHKVFFRGFLKGVRLVQQKTRAKVKGLTPSQASNHFLIDSNCDQIESEVYKAFALEEDDEIVEIE
ncbi:hypothetical protein IEQ34_007993 [Dendrobium chrysotoxum]|uniref:Uncharacterized protein n=1 Tax=Dendrobium chrysotoxum TaxID=161865 RepID=A0AAV7H2R8_DENCH|nr:hypothetical protein IEQ34_007993 [Dendrobium chrysotoxum]